MKNHLFTATVINDYFGPKVPNGSLLIFQRGRPASPGDIVAVRYVAGDPDFCIEPFREGVEYFAVAIRVSFNLLGDTMSQAETIIDNTAEQANSLSVSGLSYAFADLAKSVSEVVRSIEQAREDSAVQDVELICLEHELYELKEHGKRVIDEAERLILTVLRPKLAEAFPDEFAENPDGFELGGTVHHQIKPSPDAPPTH